MESMRDINRIMEREIAKGSCPLKLEHIEFGDYSYQEIASSDKMNEVLSYLLRIGAFSQYAGKTIINNVYMDMKGNNIFNSIKRYTRKLKPEYNGDVYLETVRCYFSIPQENLEKCRYTYQGAETYAFLMSDKYILALFTHCLVARKEDACKYFYIEGFTEKEYGMVTMENVKNVLFQVLLFDNIDRVNEKLEVNLISIFLLK